VIWLKPRVVDRLSALRGPGESFSDVILRLAKASSAPARLDVFCHPSARGARD
jgi:predicted CopG family antitoxin